MNSTIAIIVIVGYFLLLITISYFTSKNANTWTFFTADKSSPWYLVSFGMIGATLSGVTFISVPGYVGSTQFSYYQLVFGYMAGYMVIAYVLLPLYYRLNLVSIYSYLDQRFGERSYTTGAFFFLLSRVIGASFRLFLVAGVLQIALFNELGVPFWVSVLVTIGLIWIYTFRGGIKTIVWTDTLQTFFMLSAVVISVILIKNELSLGFGEMVSTIAESDYSQMFYWDWKDDKNFFKQFFAGAFVTIVMTGLDQDMMQKNLTVKTLKDSQKNMIWFSSSLFVVNLLFLCLGALLYIYSDRLSIPIPARTDDLFPTLALNHFTPFAGIVFLLGITAAAYSSADSALTSLTTSFCVDFLKFKKDSVDPKLRIRVHLGFSIILFMTIMIFKAINDDAVIRSLFTVAGFTYGPLLGLYAFGLFTKLKVKDLWVPLVCVLSPLLSYFLYTYSEQLFGGYKFGFEILIPNGLFTFIGLWLLRRKDD